MIRARRLIKSFFYAYRGLLKVFREEQNIRIQLMAALVTAAAGIFYRISRTEWFFMAFAFTLVFLMEIINSAIERTADVLKPRIDSYVKEIKDIMAGAVMLSAAMCLVAGLVIFLPYIFGGL